MKNVSEDISAFRHLRGEAGGSRVDYCWRHGRYGLLLIGISDGRLCWARFADDDDRVQALQQLGEAFPHALLQERDGGDLADRAAASIEGELCVEADEVGLWGSDFRVAVWRAVCRIPRGEVRSYAQVAEMAGYPGASRATGSALHVNPITVLIPCHRVVSASQLGKPLTAKTVGRYFSAPEIKLALLEMEGAAPYFRAK